MRKIPVLLSVWLLVMVSVGRTEPRSLWLDDLPIAAFTEGIRPVQVKVNYAKDKIRIAGTAYERGLGAQSVCVLSFDLNKNARRFTALVGADDQANPDLPITFTVVAD